MSADESPIERRTAHLGIVHSTTIEINPFLKRCDRLRQYLGDDHFVVRGGFWRDHRLAFMQVGMGPRRATRGTHALIDGHQPRWILSAGFSGALVPELKTGDIVVASSTLDADGNELKIDLKMPANPSQGLHVGRLLTIPEVAKSPEDKQRLGRETGAIAVDMESAAVAAVCRERKVRFMAVRVISDAMNETLPDEALTILSDRGAVQIGAAVSALWKRPGSAAELWKLRTAANEAASRLGFFLEGVVGRLCEP